MGRKSRGKRDRPESEFEGYEARVMMCLPQDLEPLRQMLREAGKSESEIAQVRHYVGAIPEDCQHCNQAIQVGPMQQQARSECDLHGLPVLVLCPVCAVREIAAQQERAKVAGEDVGVAIGNLNNPNRLAATDKCPTCGRTGQDVRPRGNPQVRECQDCSTGRALMWMGQPKVIVAGPIPGVERTHRAVDTTCDRCGTDVYLHPPSLAQLEQDPDLRKVCYDCMMTLVPASKRTIIPVTDLEE